MKLYYCPGVCSLASHIVLQETGLPFESVRVDLGKHALDDGSDYYAINPRGYVPLLELEDGQLLSEGQVIMQYLADKVPEKRLAPAWGTMARYRLNEWLAFINSELHKNFGPLFNAEMPESVKDYHRERVLKRFKWLDDQLAGKEYVTGDNFTVADAYLFVVVGWAKHVGVDLSGFGNLMVVIANAALRPAVQKALKAEGLA